MPGHVVSGPSRQPPKRRERLGRLVRRHPVRVGIGIFVAVPLVLLLVLPQATSRSRLPGQPARHQLARQTVEPAGSLPTVTSVSPGNGPPAGGTSVAVDGTGFTGATAVDFGADAATTYSVNSSTSITATSPAEPAGTVDITVTTGNGTSQSGAADQFTYDAPPSVSGLSPSSSPSIAGGQTVTITGTGFVSGATVRFGGAAALFVTVDSSTEITCDSPSSSTAGTVDVTVTTPGGTSETSTADQFTYGDPQAFVANYGSGTITVIDATTDAVESTIRLPAGAKPDALALSPNGAELYVADPGTGSVEAYSTLTGSLLQSLTGLAYPDSVVDSPASTELYVGDRQRDEILAYPLDHGVPGTSPTYTIGGLTFLADPLALAFPPDSGSSGPGYVALAGDNGVATFAQGASSPVAAVADPQGDFAEPDAIDFTPTGATAFVADAATNEVATISTTSGAASGVVPLEGASEPILDPTAIECGSSHCYVASAGNDSVDIISDITTTPEITYSITSPSFAAPVALGEPPGNQQLFVVDEASGTVSVIATPTHDLLATVTVGSDPVAIAIQQGRG